MKATKKSEHVNLSDKLSVTTEELQELLSLGRQSTVEIGNAAGAKVQIGNKRVIWNVNKIKNYLNEIST